MKEVISNGLKIKVVLKNMGSESTLGQYFIPFDAKDMKYFLSFAKGNWLNAHVYQDNRDEG